MTDPPLIASLRAAVEARPDDLPLRLHLARLLLDADRSADAVSQLAIALQQRPDDVAARELMARAIASPAAAPGRGAEADTRGAEADTRGAEADTRGAEADTRGAEADTQGTETDETEKTDVPVDWSAYERELSDVVPPRFAVPGNERVRAGDEPDPVGGEADRIVDVESSSLRLADVGGMDEVKKRLEIAFLGPMRSPELRRMFGKSLRGGLLLYGPPGCGKTFLARAVAGELGAGFISVSIVDVLNMWVGSSERNLHGIFETARRNAPCVLFLDEIDAIGHKRSQLHSSAMRTLGNQLLAELDGVDGGNEGVFTLAATNAPWDVDPALRRPGRLDRTVLVAPPDAAARRAILEYHLRDRPIAGIDLDRLVAATEEYSGADLAHVCESASEYALHDSIASGAVRMIEQRDVERALRDVRSSVGAWLATARNVALFANEGGVYDDLAGYLKKRRHR